MKTKLFFIALLTTNIAFATPPVDEGKVIFTSRCASCHNVNKNLTGPALAGVHERRSMEWLTAFIKSSQSLVKSGDKDAVAVYNQYNKIPMPDHPDLTDENIKSLVEYIKAETVVAGKEETPFAKPSKMRPAFTPLTINNYGFFIVYLAIIAILIAAMVFAVQIKEYERHRRGEA